ncbi:ComEC/Rec2 family competence protein [Stigmatella aurantiaca]|uniref:Late competence protein n=1 Tax=Stigmatella aurantiaca (strain DW4/3-1) TaxID=378806 RepID=Q098Q3_STIAD|nr:ComEC/Rec2 family competence protein [Stigmatella aurantiaca]ADO74138.1 Metallo-beta-lactamase family protein [Stigmatella aurantiaca DW4/3-1]EAU68226.1 late competence protein [Stigmatella aurantiaca DW4/3-1]
MLLPPRLCLLFILLLASVGRAAPAPVPVPTGNPLTVYFFDVGQGDAALVVSPAGKTVLIDGGPPEAGPRLVSRLRQLVHAPLDLVLLTHPHLDHLGSMRDAIQAVGAKRFMDPGFDHPSAAYRDLLEFVGQEVGQVMTASPNPQTPHTFLTIGLGEGVQLTLYWPRHPLEPFLKDTRSDANSNSIVARLSYGKTSFLFTGDAEPDTEQALLQKKVLLSSTVLKVAHHGGRHASTAPFLAAVKPQTAVISCGANNEYGHPNPEVLERLKDVGTRLFRTDQQGEIKAVSNGTTVTFQAERGPAEPPQREWTKDLTREPSPPPPERPAVAAPPETPRYVSLKGSEVFHREDCATLKRAKTKERKIYTRRADAARERRAAEDCHP